MARSERSLWVISVHVIGLGPICRSQTTLVFGWLIQASWIFESLGFTGELSSPFVPALLIISLFSGLFTFWFSPFDSLWSRKHEYEADAFARNAMCEADSLKNALRKLYKENLSNLLPHPIYSSFYYSHPTLVERESALINGNN